MATYSKHLFQDGRLYVLPVGGCGQFGGNMTFYGADGTWVVVDCGAAFADDRMPGVDLVMPNPTAIPAECRKNIAALVITHAHEDHVGGAMHLWPELGYPDIYASPFAREVLIRKFSEAEYAQRPTIIPFESEDTLSFGPIEMTPVPVCHSIPEAHALFIRSPLGTVLHSGDWNIDPHPVIGETTNGELFTKYAGVDGVVAYIGDSTNAEYDGFSASERVAAEELEAVFGECEGKIAITIFSSNIARIHSICMAAQATGRRVAVAGRSLESMVHAARECGYLGDIEPFLDVRDMGYLPDRAQVYIITGSQGEQRATLSMVARGMHKHISLKRGDHVLFSARKIPGNERAINDLMNNLIAGGVEVITPKERKIHVSGHPYRDEIRRMMQWVRPKIVIPVHGEMAQMSAQGHIAKTLGNGPAQVCVPENGALIEISPHGADIVARYDCEMRPIVFREIVAPDHAPLRDRRKMSFNGCAFVSICVQSGAGEIEDINLSVIGLLDLDRKEHQALYDECAQGMEDSFYRLSRADRSSVDKVEEAMRLYIRRFFRDLFDVKPITEVHVSMV